MVAGVLFWRPLWLTCTFKLVCEDPKGVRRAQTLLGAIEPLHRVCFWAEQL
jgi:hypothetical protein